MRYFAAESWRTLARALLVGAGILSLAIASGCLLAAAGAGAGAGYVAGHEHEKNHPSD